MKKFWVYVHTCPNEKRYVGITTKIKPELRWAKGRGYYQNKHFYSAIKKYGWNNIKHEAWELTCESEMYYAEKYLIAYYHTTESEFGYNHSSGGEHSSLGCRHSEETRKKLSEAHKREWLDPEYRKKISEAQKKGRSDSEYRRKVSENSKKKWLDPEYRKKQIEARKGKSLGEEHRKHMSEAQKKRCLDPEVRKHRSELQKERWLDPEYREKMLEARKGKPHKPLPRVKIKLPDGTVVEITKPLLTRHYVNKGKKFEYVS